MSSDQNTSADNMPSAGGDPTAGGSSTASSTASSAASSTATSTATTAASASRPTTWHQYEADNPMRRVMIANIIKMLKEKKPNADEVWKKKLPDMARRLEDSLYRAARSKESYNNYSTLKQRLQEVALRMTKKTGASTSNRQIPKEYVQAMLNNLTAERRQKFLALPKEQQRQHIISWTQRRKEFENIQRKKKMDIEARSRGEEGGDQKRVVNMSDINPLMSAPAPKSTSSGRTNFASVKQEPAKKMTAAQIKKKAAAAAAHRNSGMNSASQEQQQQVLRQQQQRLLLLRHASKCEAGTPGNPKECPATKHCAQMKKLWSHIAKCKNQHCSTPHCVSSRYVLSHYHRCKDQNCSVCSPVRDAIQRHKDKRQEE